MKKQTAINHPVNEEVFRLMRERVQQDLWNRFISFMSSRLKDIKDACVDDVKKLYEEWKEAVIREKRDRAMLGEDY